MDALAQLKSALAGRYDVEREIGQGGMATVYLARDVRHDRRVALKLLNPELGAVLGVERFLAEIRVTANLQHPNLLPLFDSGEAEGHLFYVMPYVEGESLRAKLQREKQLPVDEAIHVATAVASALDYAHRHGVIHRDLKPENILLHEGQPMVADFGIALAVSNAGGSRVTQTGVSLGTPQYMSPEQATGDRAIDGRTDIYSLGAVLYEMLAGDPPHTGSTAQAIIAKVITDKPRAVRLARDTVPGHVEWAIERALAKLPPDRFATAHEFADALLGRSVAIPSGTSTPASISGERGITSRRRRWYLGLPWVVAIAAVSALVTMRSSESWNELPTTRFSVVIPTNARLEMAAGAFLAMSPTGRTIAYVGQTPNGTQVMLRFLDDLQVKPVAGTENGISPFFSPDGAWVGFVSGGKLKKVRLSGGAPVTIADLGTIPPTGIVWGSSGDIVLGSGNGGLWRVPSSGGPISRFTTLDKSRGETSHRGPYFLSDGKTVSFIVYRMGISEAQIAFATPDGRHKVSDQLGLKSQQVGPDLFAFATNDGTLMGARFDVKRLSLGVPVPIFDNVYVRSTGYSAWAASANGTLVVLRGEPTSQLTIVTREGRASPLSGEFRSFRRPRVSPNGKRVAVEIATAGPSTADIWVHDRASQTLSRLTFGGGNTDPLWTRDGARIAYAHRDSGRLEPDIFWQQADGADQPTPLYRASSSQWPFGWSFDGRTLVYDELSRNRPGQTVIKAAVIGDSTGREIVVSVANARLPSLSPDGRWIAYASNESGRYEVYVSSFPGPGGKWQVSNGGGDQPLWAHTGREIFYRDPTSIVTASVVTKPSFAVTSRSVLFDDGFVRAATLNYDVMPDDKHFVMLKSADESTQLIVVTNWLPELRARLAQK